MSKIIHMHHHFYHNHCPTDECLNCPVAHLISADLKISNPNVKVNSMKHLHDKGVTSDKVDLKAAEGKAESEFKSKARKEEKKATKTEGPGVSSSQVEKSRNHSKNQGGGKKGQKRRTEDDDQEYIMKQSNVGGKSEMKSSQGPSESRDESRRRSRKNSESSQNRDRKKREERGKKQPQFEYLPKNLTESQTSGKAGGLSSSDFIYVPKPSNEKSQFAEKREFSESCPQPSAPTTGQKMRFLDSENESSEEEPEAPPKNLSIFEKYGGEIGVKKIVVHLFNELLLKDASLAPFFKHAKMARIERMLVSFMGKTMGSLFPYKGKSMTDAHKGHRISSAQFKAFLEHLFKAMRVNGVDVDDATSIKNIFNSYKHDIVK